MTPEREQEIRELAAVDDPDCWAWRDAARDLLAALDQARAERDWLLRNGDFHERHTDPAPPGLLD